jgi:hypothetical protein
LLGSHTYPESSLPAGQTPITNRYNKKNKNNGSMIDQTDHRGRTVALVDDNTMANN